jgi:hypothetical protein
MSALISRSSTFSARRINAVLIAIVSITLVVAMIRWRFVTAQVAGVTA